MPTLDDLNRAPHADFVAALGAVFAHAPWIAEAVAGQRPFPTVTALLAAMRGAVDAAPEAARDALLTDHPECTGWAARAESIAASTAEPTSPEIDRLSGADLSGAKLSEAELARVEGLNAAYAQKFGFPFILCIQRHGRASLLRTFVARLAADPETERGTALAEVFRIAAIRLGALVGGAGDLRTTGRISTHVLDTVAGRPAPGVAVELHEWISETATALIARTKTNADGRTDAPLIGDRPVPIAAYELRFHIGDHFRATQPGLPEPPFLDVVTLRFGVADPEGHYHVPLVASPWSYQTYRGS